MADKLSSNKNYEIIAKNLKKFIYVHCSSGYKQSLQEILSKPEVLSQIKDTKATEEVILFIKPRL